MSHGKPYKPFLIIISSPSGAGKTSITKRLLEVDSNVVMSVSATTRPKRTSEIDGVDYHFISKDEYEAYVEKGKFLEYAKVFDHYYGTPADMVQGALQSGKDVLFDIDWQGARELISKKPAEILSIFILPPSMKELKTRLKARGEDDEKIINNRMNKAFSEIDHYSEYNYVLINNNLDECVEQIKQIVSATRFKLSHNPYINKFVRELYKEK